MGLSTANQWRANRGARALSFSSTLYQGACAWAKQLAATGGLSHQSGNYGEVAARSRLSCSDMWSLWLGSQDHYRLIVSTQFDVGGFACYRRADGLAWAVGRVS
jgi:uncharacterized protein YkwD